MARLLVMAADKDSGAVVEPDVYARDYLHKGDVVNVEPSGWVWGKEEGPPFFVCIDVPGNYKAAAVYREPWQRGFDITHEVLDAATDSIRISIDTKTPVHANGRGGFKAAEFDEMVNSWGMTAVYAKKKITIDVDVWTILQSQGFYGNVPTDSVVFSEVFTPPVHRVTATYPAEIHPNAIAAIATVRGGDVVSNESGAIVADFTVEDVVTNFTSDMQGVDNRVGKRLFRIAPATVDAAITAGGTLALSPPDFMAALEDKGA